MSYGADWTCNECGWANLNVRTKCRHCGKFWHETYGHNLQARATDAEAALAALKAREPVVFTAQENMDLFDVNGQVIDEWVICPKGTLPPVMKSPSTLPRQSERTMSG